MRSLYSSARLASSRLLLVAIISTSSCGKRDVAAVKDPAGAQAAIQNAFKQAKPEFKAAADEAAAAIQNDPAKALLQLQSLSTNPELDPQQRNATQDSMLMLTVKLRAAAAQGDADAEKALEAYRATK